MGDTAVISYRSLGEASSESKTGVKKIDGGMQIVCRDRL